MSIILRARFVGYLAILALVLAGTTRWGFVGASAVPLSEQPLHSSRALRLPSVDVNADGRADHPSIDNTEGGQIRIGLSAGRGAIELALAEPLTGVTFFDYDADGDPDIIGLGMAGRLYFWENQGGGRVVPGPTPTWSRPTSHGPFIGRLVAPAQASSLGLAQTERHAPSMRRVDYLAVRAEESRRVASTDLEWPSSVSRDLHPPRPPPPSLSV